MKLKLSGNRKAQKMILGICLAAIILLSIGLFAYIQIVDTTTLGRGISICGLNVSRLTVEKAQEKGAKNILVFDASRAFIVNVPQNRVITAISQEEMQDNVFTNIDGAVLLK